MATNTAIWKVSDVANFLKIPRSTVYKLCQNKHIPATKIGRHWRFDRQVLEEWFRKQSSLGGPEDVLGSPLEKQ